MQKKFEIKVRRDYDFFPNYDLSSISYYTDMVESGDDLIEKIESEPYFKRFNYKVLNLVDIDIRGGKVEWTILYDICDVLNDDPKRIYDALERLEKKYGFGMVERLNSIERNLEKGNAVQDRKNKVRALLNE